MLALLAALATPAWGQTSTGIGQDKPYAMRPMVPAPMLPRRAPGDLAAGSAYAPPAEPQPSLSRLTVVELPPENSSPTARRHHAISIPFDGARRTVRRFGIDATECALQFRAPARLARSPVAGARAAIDVQAQVRMACRL
jgi:hypothetical protein